MIYKSPWGRLELVRRELCRGQQCVGKVLGAVVGGELCVRWDCRRGSGKGSTLQRSWHSPKRGQLEQLKHCN